MPAQRKIAIVEELIESFNRSTIVIGAGFTGLNVNTTTALRSALRSGSIEFRVVKNNLANIAAQETDNPQISELLSGSTALILGYSDPLEAAKLLNNYLQASRIPLVESLHRVRILDDHPVGHIFQKQDSPVVLRGGKPESVSHAANENLHHVMGAESGRY